MKILLKAKLCIYVDYPSYALYDFKLKMADGKEISLSSKGAVKLIIPIEDSHVTAWLFDGDDIKSALQSTNSNSVSISGLNYFMPVAVVDKNSTKWLHRTHYIVENSGLPSNDVDKDKINSIISGGGFGSSSVSNIKVDAGSYLDGDDDIESSKITSGTTADTVKKATSNVKKICEVKAILNCNEVQANGKVKVYISALDGVKAEYVKIYLVDEKMGEKTEFSFKLSDDKKTYETEIENLGIFAVCTDEKLPAEKVTTPTETTVTANAEFKDIEKHWAK